MSDLAPEPTNPTRSRALEAAAALFGSKGYAATTTRELARLVGVGSASLYYHMGSKEELLYALCVDSLQCVQEEVVRAIAAQDTPLERLRALIRTHVTATLKDPDKHAAVLFELRSLSPGRRDEVTKMRSAYESLVCETISEAQQAGVLRRDLEAKSLALALLNLINWSIFWFRPAGPLSRTQLAEILLTVYMEGVMERAPSSLLDQPVDYPG